MFLFWERESERETERGYSLGRGRDTESEAGSGLWTVSTESNVGLEPTSHEIMTWAEVGCLTDWATRSPLIFLNVYLFLRESVSRGGSEREGDTESESETGSRFWAVSAEPDAGLEPTSHEIMTWAEVGCLIDWATPAPQQQYFL